MKLKKEQVKHIAELARLDVAEEELEKYSEQLTGILEFIEKLQEVNTDDVEPTAQVTGMENIFREDEVKEWDEKEVADSLEQAPDLEDGQIKVKRILA